jgi:GTP-binding protein HflX
LLVVVVDAADYERELQLQTTLGLLEKLGAQDIPRFYVFTKADRLPAAGAPTPAELERWSDGQPWSLLSTDDPAAVAQLKARLLLAARGDEAELSGFVPYAATELMALIYGSCRVSSTDAEGDGLRMRFSGPPGLVARIRRGLEVYK